MTSIELPGSAGSSKLTEPWPFERTGEWLNECIAALRLPEPPLAIGHSNSGGTLLHAAAQSNSYRGIVLTGTVGAGGECSSLPGILFGRSIDVLREPLISIHGAPDILFNIAHHTRNLFRQIPLAATDCSEIARRVTAPALLAHGRHDSTIRMRCAEQLAGLIPHVELYICERGSHNWLVEYPQEFVDAVARFDEGLI